MIYTRAQEALIREPREYEAQLVQRARQDDENAIRELIDRHRVRLIRTAANILHNPTEAEDIAQESFLKAFRELHRLRDDKAFASFIYRICVRLCVDHLRLKRAETSPLEPTIPLLNGTIETRLLVGKLLEKLPPDLRTTLLLREVEQLSYSEVAREMAVPIGTVRSRLHTARERFRSLWLSANQGRAGNTE